MSLVINDFNAEADTIFRKKEKRKPLAIHYSGLALPLYTMDEPALIAHTLLCIGFALIFSVEVQVRVVN